MESTTIIREVKSNPKDRIEIEIGDSKQPDFKPQFKVSRWDNEVNFSMRAEEKIGATMEESNGVIKYITPEYEVHQYEKPEASEDGGFEFEWILKSPPLSNILTATIQTKGLDFFYQPELTAEEIADGNERPDNVIGSYAVYHSTKRDNIVGGVEYKTGKAFHIYRPHAVDADGVKVWCDLNIDTENQLLTVSVPQDYLDNAVYPILVDPTFGYATIGATYNGDVSSGSDSYARGMLFGSALAGTLTEIHAALRASTNMSNGVSWSFADTQPASSWNKLESWSSDSYTTTAVWKNRTGLSVSFNGATNAYVGTRFYYEGSVNGPGIMYDTAVGTNGFGVSEIGGYTVETTRNYSVYATYTASSNSGFFAFM